MTEAFDKARAELGEEAVRQAYREALKRKYTPTPESIKADEAFWKAQEDRLWDPTPFPWEVKRDRPDA